MNKPEWIQPEQTATDGIVVASCSVADLLSNELVTVTHERGALAGRLAIPEYQRPYAWGAAQVDRLLNDLAEYASESCTHDYYLGSLILHQDEHGWLNVVDGQQRLTTLALLAYVRDGYQSSLRHNSPSSQRRIAINLYHLRQRNLPMVDFQRVNVTLVVTPYLDDAYRFFETQNTGGVPLNGVQVIKAIHLRAADAAQRDEKARKWEAWKDLEQVVTLLMQGRYWNILQHRHFPLSREKQKRKTEIVAELSERCAKGGDVRYRLDCDGVNSNAALDKRRYSMRQPLNLGDNTIAYLDYFSELYKELIIYKHGPDAFNQLCEKVVDEKCASPHLRNLFLGAVIIYVSQFGRDKLLEAALWMFRMIYSVRVVNDRAVREQSAEAFARDHHLFDLIVHSYNHEQLIEQLRAYRYTVSGENIDKKSNAKGRFIKQVADFFNIDKNLSDSKEGFSEQYDHLLVKGIAAVLGDRDE